MKISKIFSAISAVLLMSAAMASANAELNNKNQRQAPFLTTLKLQTADSGLGHGPDPASSMLRNKKQHKYMYTHILQTGRHYADESLTPQPYLNTRAKPDDLTATSKKRQNKINRLQHGSTISGSTQRQMKSRRASGGSRR